MVSTGATGALVGCVLSLAKVSSQVVVHDIGTGAIWRTGKNGTLNAQS